ncbi:MAG: hypothetical protein AAF639_08585, partial [Chloroflexota bacterium]
SFSNSLKAYGNFNMLFLYLSLIPAINLTLSCPAHHHRPTADWHSHTQWLGSDAGGPGVA